MQPNGSWPPYSAHPPPLHSTPGLIDNFSIDAIELNADIPTDPYGAPSVYSDNIVFNLPSHPPLVPVQAPPPVYHYPNPHPVQTPGPNPDLHPLTIRVPPRSPAMQLRNRKNSMASASQASGSVYDERMDPDAEGEEFHDEDAEGEDDDEQPAPPPREYVRSRSGRRILKASYQESESEDAADIEEPPPPQDLADEDADGTPDEDDEPAPRRPGLRSRRATHAHAPPSPSDEGDAPRYATRLRSKKPEPLRSQLLVPGPSARALRAARAARRSQRATSAPTRPSSSRRLRTRRSARDEADADGYIDEPEDEGGSSDAEMDDAAPSSEPAEPEPGDGDLIVGGEDEDDAGVEVIDNDDGKPYALRQRRQVNYAIPPPLEEIPTAPPKPKKSQRSAVRKGPGWSANGTELGRFLGLPGPDDSDSDAPTRMPGRGGLGAGGPAFAGGLGAAPANLADLATAAGGPSNFGKVGDAALADADPLGVNQNVTFDEVGGLDDHINSLKEMTLLPLLYPEVFQRFGLTPPRGVLFHGPPGTGKTLLARALAASTRSNGKGISFFMRKGADVLSKWVGEAERQLRLLFEEARNCQPSIIFFDEIDGLAPVRSSKQDQIHASIVSTLLALMDGMDGRGQVVVIGATNRPDAVDPALRRPGRFDREFYFPLPNLAARERILGIMTRKWEGWDEEQGKEKVRGLAKLTKGYGGADLRALCTEAALNAVQRRYPQIYKSNDRLLLKPETIGVELRDFMISVKKIVPSSARSSASVASPLPVQLEPLLADHLERVKAALDRLMPPNKKRTALEEAEWEDEGPEGALERELMLQSMETLRVFRPRLVLYGTSGMGQSYVATAALHHLEGYHVQNLDLGTLLGDATRSPEAAIVQLFVEAKRHQPSVIYIPSLSGWCAAVSDTARSTVQSMLNTLAPTDPVLLLAVVDGPFFALPRDVRAWFGPTRETRLELTHPTEMQRDAFFAGLLKDVRRPPNEFPDGVKRKKRVLEVLPVAPPLEPRKPSPAELAAQAESDGKLLTLLKFRLNPILVELKKKHKRFCKPATEEYQFPLPVQPPVVEANVVVDLTQLPNGDGTVDKHGVAQGQTPVATDGTTIANQAQAQLQLPPPPPPPQPLPPQPQLFDIDLEKVHRELFNDRYLTPLAFLEDIEKIVHNARVCAEQDGDRFVRAQTMYNAAELCIQDFDAGFRAECERMAARERQRRAERRKERELARASARQSAERERASQEAEMGLRRSARANGLEPEFTVGDPLLLERRLKRQRSEVPSAEGEGSGAGRTGEEPAAKRSRVSSEVGDVVMGPAQNLFEVTHHTETLAISLTDAATTTFALDASSALSGAPAAGLSNTTAAPTQPKTRAAGFDPTLLNPASPTDRFIRPQGAVPSEPMQGGPSIQAAPYMQDAVAAFEFGQPSKSPTPRPLSGAQNMPLEARRQELGTDTPHSEQPQPQADAPAQTQEKEKEHTPILMEIERTPSPLPEFRIDVDALDDLRTKLARDTTDLNVEQLEQLRAAALAAVWRHRQAWDRAELVVELRRLVGEFVEEVRLDMGEDAMGL
ncbi:hypothetical protein K488DRAFT_55566 [Vararia minispora EC-137]|uniref:Uncharacterized protein n=1 Tax=Vararia minispora EC-137 TaxID=1314806 RepID=A0ACB8QDX0_9AGAM|nr:hypothetical protein K488DRAFT_55566 [Vararia minispora EC-137]